MRHLDGPVLAGFQSGVHMLELNYSRGRSCASRLRCRWLCIGIICDVKGQRGFGRREIAESGIEGREEESTGTKEEAHSERYENG